MAAPTLRLRRGSGAPSGSIAVVGEPFFDTGGDFYVATATNTFAHIGGSTYTSRVDNFLTDAVAGASTAILTLEDQQATPGSVSLDVPSSVTADYTLTFPAALPGSGGNYFLQVDQASGDMSFVAAGSGAASQVSTVSNSTDATFFLTFVDSDNGTAGDESVFTDAGVSYNPNTNLLTVTGEVDAGSIDVGSTGIDIAGSTSGTVTLVTPADAGTTTITFPATTGTVVTTGDSETVTSTMIANATIVDGDISTTAAIAFSKLAALTDGNILVGNASDVATSVAVTGDVSISNTGVTSIAAGAIVNADISTGAAIDFSKLASLADGNILVGNASNVATSVATSGDVTLANDGTFAIATGAIVNADISATAEIAVSKLANGSSRQLLQTDAAGTGVEFTSNVDVPGTLDVTGAATFDNNVIVTGNLTVNGTTTTVSTANSSFEDTLLLLNRADAGSQPVNNTNDIGLYLERGSAAAEDEVAVIFDESEDEFVIAFTSSANDATTVAFQDDAAGTPTLLDFVPLRVGALRIQDASSQLAGGLISAGGTASVSVIETLSAAESETEGIFDATEGEAGRYLLNVTVDGGFY